VTWDTEDRSITVIDDGCGMSLDTLVNKLLFLGGTLKAEGSTGAFGKAKEVLFFAHKEYLVHTKNLLLTGSGDDYQISETTDHLDGTLITIYIHEGENFEHLVNYATQVAEMIETNCEIIVDGNNIPCKFPKGELRKQLDIGSIYVNEALSPIYSAKVRMNGIWMFDQYIGEDMPHITLELSGDSIASMTSNRDGMKDNCLHEANEFFQKLAADRKSALFPDKVEMTIHAQGIDGQQIRVTDDDLEFLEARYRDMPHDQFLAAIAGFFSDNGEGLDHTLTKMRCKDVDRLDYTRLKYFGFKWDTIHKFETGKETEARKFLDGSAARAKRAKTLLTIWGETLKQVMLDTEMYHSFTVGFNWDENQQAQFENQNGNICFYLNPNILSKYPLNNKKGLARKLKQIGCHEVAHFIREYHDEYFVGTMEDFQEKTWKSDKLYARIAKIK